MAHKRKTVTDLDQRVIERKKKYVRYQEGAEFWLALMVALYVIRNGRKAGKVVAQSVMVALIACGTVMAQSLKAHATILEIWYDSNGNRIGQLIILDNKPDGQSYKKFRSSWPDGVAGGAGGANGGKKAGKNRIDKNQYEKENIRRI